MIQGMKTIIHIIEQPRRNLLVLNLFRTRVFLGGWGRLLIDSVFDFRENLGNFKEKPTRKNCFSREIKRLALRIYLAKFCLAVFCKDINENSFKSENLSAT